MFCKDLRLKIAASACLVIGNDNSKECLPQPCIQAIAEDLEALVRENQMIGRQLVSLTAERDRWQGDVSASTERAQRAEALARARESENTHLCGDHEVRDLHHLVCKRHVFLYSHPRMYNPLLAALSPGAASLALHVTCESRTDGAWSKSDSVD